MKISIANGNKTVSIVVPDGFNYSVNYVDGNVAVTLVPAPQPEVVGTFVYDKGYPSRPSFRKIVILREGPDYIEGLDLHDGRQFKRFLKHKILGGIVLVR